MIETALLLGPDLCDVMGRAGAAGFAKIDSKLSTREAERLLQGAVPRHGPHMPLDDSVNARARGRRGAVPAAELGSSPARAGARHNLVHLHHGVYVAATQPVGTAVLLASVRESTAGRQVAVMAEGALWLHGAIPTPPARLVLGVPLGSSFLVRSPLRTRRVAPSVLAGGRVLDGCLAVALEVAVIQAAAEWSTPRVRELVEELVRARRTTLARLRSRCRRGLKGSARVRLVCDELVGGSMDADVRRLKAALEVRGVEGLEVEVRFTNEGGGSAYADLFHRESLTAFEVDGLLEHAQRERFRADRRRDRWMRREHRVTTLRIDVLEIREDLDALADELVWFLLPEARQRPA